jgi:hypothetical protein
MALRFDATGDSLTRSGNNPSITAFTIMCWAKISTDRNAYSCILCIGTTNDGNLYYLGTGSDGTTLLMYNPANDGPNGTNLTVGTWYHVALVCDGTSTGNLRAYLNGVLNSTHNGHNGPTNAMMRFGNNFYTEFFNGCVAAVKVYSAALSADRILQERLYYTPVHTTNLQSWTPLMHPTAGSNGTDFSGSAFNFTVNGTLTVEDGPPIAWSRRRRARRNAATGGGTLYTQNLSGGLTTTGSLVRQPRRILAGTL